MKLNLWEQQIYNEKNMNENFSAKTYYYAAKFLLMKLRLACRNFDSNCNKPQSLNFLQ